MLDIAARCTTATGCGAAGELVAEEGAEEGEGDARPLYDDLLPLDLEVVLIAVPFQRSSTSGSTVQTK